MGGSFTTGLNLCLEKKDLSLVYNDIDKVQYNIWRYMKQDMFLFLDKVDEVSKFLSDLGSYDEVMHYIDLCDDELVFTVCNFILLNSLKFGGGVRFTGYKGVDYRPDFVIDFLKESNRIQLYNLSYGEIINKFDSPDTFFLFDPPYYTYKSDSYYRTDCRYFYHKAFRDSVKAIKGKFLITYNIDDYIIDLFKDYHQDIYDTNKYKKTLYIRNFDVKDEREWNYIILKGFD